MNNLHLPNPKMMDVAVPANLHMGLAQDAVARRGWALLPSEARAMIGQPGVALIDLRERREREKYGVIPGSLHAPYPDLEDNVKPGGIINQLGHTAGSQLLFYCAYGERSAMAVQAAQEAGLASARHIQGGLEGWRKAGGPVAAS
jgi:rhodanese-related sulfurtransferase